VLSVTAKVPILVIGFPVTLNKADGTVISTDMTVPIMDPLIDALTIIPPGVFVIFTFAPATKLANTGAPPVDPINSCPSVNPKADKSEIEIVLKAGSAGLPLTGPAKKVLALCVIRSAVRVPPFGPEIVGTVILKIEFGRLRLAVKSPVLFTKIKPGPFVMEIPGPADK
jgi:hypothetical protein